MILESLGIEYKEKGKHVYIVVLGKKDDDEFVSVMGVSAISPEDCARQCGKENVISIMPLSYMLEKLEMRDAIDDFAPYAGYGGKNEDRPH
jgi:hypothetical protein